MGGRRKVAAVLEVLGVYLAGQLVMLLLARVLHIELANPLRHLTASASNAELVTASGQLTKLLAAQYLGWFLLIVPIGWWYRRTGLREYGLTRAAAPLGRLLLLGLATALVAFWPTRLLEILNTLTPLGETAPWRQAMFDMSWRRWEFWLFMAAGSYIVPPIVEELFYRGYCQRRLAEDLGQGTAIATVATLFVFSHSQYLIANAYNFGMIVSLLIGALGLGILFAYTKSLIPSMAAHALINIPAAGVWQWIVLGIMVIGAIWLGRGALRVTSKVFQGTAVMPTLLMAILGAGYAVAANRWEVMVIVAVGALHVALVLEALERRARRAATAASGASQ
jgi:membrane protease YdiL (CAAX protease family)